MVEWHTKSRKKSSGGRRNTPRRCNKKLAWKGGVFSSTKLVVGKDEERVVERKRGSSVKVKLKKATYANLFDKEKGKVLKAKILTVLETPSNIQFARRNIITKGSIIEVELKEGNKTAMVTSRPGQDGIVNAKAVEWTEKKQKKPRLEKKHPTKPEIKEKPLEGPEIEEKPLDEPEVPVSSNEPKEEKEKG